VVAAHEATSARGARARLGPGSTPVIGPAAARSAREVAERGVARDELAARAVREAARGSRGRARATCAASVAAARAGRARADARDDAREAHRVEPDVRVRRPSSPARAALSPRASSTSPARARRRVLDRGLEAVREVEDDVRLLHARDLARRQLDVVRLRPGG
jgi:hypothetical protein